MTGVEFLAGLIVGSLAIAWWRRGASDTHPKAVAGPMVGARVVGVYATAHTTAGDFDTGGPESVDIDCEIVTFCLPLGIAQFTGRIDSVTLHFGLVTMELPVDPPTQVRKGQSVTIVQPLLMGQ
jgi:hypothetical protein